MKDQQVSEQDRARKRALIVFQVLMYGFLFSMFLVQMYMYSSRDW